MTSLGHAVSGYEFPMDVLWGNSGRPGSEQLRQTECLAANYRRILVSVVVTVYLVRARVF